MFKTLKASSNSLQEFPQNFSPCLPSRRSICKLGRVCCGRSKRIKSKTRSQVEHVFATIKLQFGFVKLRFRGLASNLNQLLTTCALANLCTARKLLMAVPQQSRA